MITRIPFTLPVTVDAATGETTLTDKIDTDFEVCEHRAGVYNKTTVGACIAGTPLPEFIRNAVTGDSSAIPSAAGVYAQLNINNRDFFAAPVPITEIGAVDPSRDGTLLNPYIIKRGESVKLTVSSNTTGYTTKTTLFLKGYKLYNTP